jgi:hypothetical protein
MKYWVSFTSLFLFLCSCSNLSTLEHAFELAGENRSELGKVLTRYSQNPADSLKYKAACFLIENMIYYYSYEGKILDDYLQIYKEISISGKKLRIFLILLSQSLDTFQDKNLLKNQIYEKLNPII